jgi:hypothetical protein
MTEHLDHAEGIDDEAVTAGSSTTPTPSPPSTLEHRSPTPNL